MFGGLLSTLLVPLVTLFQPECCFRAAVHIDAKCGESAILGAAPFPRIYLRILSNLRTFLPYWADLQNFFHGLACADDTSRASF